LPVFSFIFKINYRTRYLMIGLVSVFPLTSVISPKTPQALMIKIMKNIPIRINDFFFILI